MRLRTIPLLAGTLLVLTWALLSTSPASASSVMVTVEITDSGFVPATVSIPPGSTVTWVNSSSEARAVRVDSGSGPDSPTIQPRFSYSYGFNKIGTYPYHDTVNPGLRGSVIVDESGTVPVATPEPAPNPTPNTPPATPPLSPSSPPPIPVSPTPSAGSGDDAADGVLTAGGAPSAPPEPHAQPLSLGYGGAQPQPETAVAARDITITAGSEWFGDPSMQNDVFESVLAPGSTVTWTVQDGIHNAYECGQDWSDAATSCSNAAWHSEQVMTAGVSWSQKFDTTGTFYYLCSIHPTTMRGRIVVEETQDPATEPDPAPDPGPDSGQEPDPRVADAASVPNGGGPLGDAGDGRLIMILIGAAAAFVISTLGFVIGGGARTAD